VERSALREVTQGVEFKTSRTEFLQEYETTSDNMVDSRKYIGVKTSEACRSYHLELVPV
jgi:hypothetical protein